MYPDSGSLTLQSVTTTLVASASYEFLTSSEIAAISSVINPSWNPSDLAEADGMARPLVNS